MYYKYVYIQTHIDLYRAVIAILKLTEKWLMFIRQMSCFETTSI